MNAANQRQTTLENFALGSLHVAAAVSLGIITLWFPATTRMWAWPWTLALAVALLFPAAALLIRSLLSRETVALPSPGWCGVALGFIAVTLASALVSPYRATSLLWSAPLLGGMVIFFLVYDGLGRDPERSTVRRHQLRVALLLGFAPLGIESVGWWIARLGEFGLADQLMRRNPYPLGHSNYTSGVALLILPTAAHAAWKHRGILRTIAVADAALAIVMIFSSSSRGGLLALGVLSVIAVWRAPFPARVKWAFGIVGTIAGLWVATINPRVRAMFSRTSAEHGVVAASNVQRNAMLTAGWRMGLERPVLGWGPGTTPLAYPRFRGGLEGGAENALQLHSLPVQLWAELGLAGVACLLAFALLVARHAARDFIAATTLGGYGVFALTDWQLDIPIFAALVAVFAACCATHEKRAGSSASSLARILVGVATLLSLAVIGLLGRRDQTPELNARALELAREPASHDRAIALLRESLARNPDQEIVHFNLGWLLVIREPAAARQHFESAARLVPDKGGVYFGLGLALLNQGRASDAANAFALECVNDPAFLASPWWREPAIATARDAAQVSFERMLARALELAPESGLTLRKLSALAPQLGRGLEGPEKSYRRERTGYPVLMRNLDLGRPLDLFDVRELRTPPPWTAGLPPKGWLASPVLLALLHEHVPLKS